MPINVLGFQTHRDHFAVDFEQKALTDRMSEMRSETVINEVFAQKYKLKDNRDWKLADARKTLRLDDNWQDKIIACAYRLFDSRPCYFSTIATDYPRRELMDNLVGKKNLSLLSSRQQANPGYRHCWVVDKPANDCVVSTTSREANQVFILYLYPNAANPQKTMLKEQRQANFSPRFLEDLSNKLGHQPEPEKIFCYIYAVLSSPSYRIRYAEFLKIDFPRIPLTSNDELFYQLVSYGEELVDLHLMKSPKLDNLITQFIEAEGDRCVDPGHPKFDESSSSVLINKKEDKFTGVPKAVWEFHIGGYQVCQKWLKDRKGRTLSEDDITHYQRIVVALQETMRLMQQIDEAIPGFPLE